MKKSFVIAIILLATPSARAQTEVTTPPAPQDTVRLQKARALVDLVLSVDQRQKRFEATVTALMSNMMSGFLAGDPVLRKELDEKPKLKSIFTRFIERQRRLVLEDFQQNTPALLDSYATAYARIYSPTELDDLITFFSTPTGMKYSNSTAQIINDPAVAAWQRGVAERARTREPIELKRLRDEIESAVAAHERDSQHS